MQGAQRAGTAMYSNVHEDSEHCATKQMSTAVGLQQIPRVVPCGVRYGHIFFDPIAI
jgi:hypothetical protein